VDFRVNEDQQALQEGIRSFCRGRIPFEQLPELEKQKGVDRSLWRELAEMGVFALRRPEAEGGVGMGASEAVLVFAELGRRLVPGPLIWSHLAAGLVDGAAGGDAVVGGIDLASDLAEPVLVEHLPGLDALLVLHADRVERLDPRALRADPVAVPLDPLTPLHRIEHVPAGQAVGGAELARRLRLEGTALSSALLLGIAEETRELAVAYAKRRVQFGRAIGSFQAIKHLLADMFVRQEVARAAVYAAGATLDDPAVGDADRAVSSARVNAGEAALRNARTCIQVHGGMGYTWEMPPHYYLKRTWVLATSFGSSELHEERLAEAIERGL
jgi:alkylation response protein AidB-like acyl-CoA dehydrogenase